MALTVLPVAGAALQSFFFYKKVDTVRSAFQQITDQVSHNAQFLVNSTFSNLTIQQIELFRNLEMALQSLQNKYEEELGFTVEKANQFVQNALAEVDTLVQRSIIEPLTSPAVQEMASRIQMLVSQIPFADQAPYVFAAHPSCLALTNFENEVMVELRGGFPQFSKEEEKQIPRLIVHDKSFLARDFYQTGIRFFVPAKALFPETSRVPNKISYSSCNIEVPFSEKTYIYGTSLYLLPEIAGTVILSYDKIEKQVITQAFSSPNYTQNSRLEGVPILNRPYTVNPPQGWQILQGSPKISIYGYNTSNPHSYHFQAVTPTSISCIVSTYGRKGVDKNVGKIEFKIDYTAFRTEETGRSMTEGPLSLSWGKWVEIDESKQNCKIIFNSFDGGQYLYDARKEHQDLFVRISRIGNKSVFFIKPPEAIMAPHFGLARL